jgi:hypothetical protein
MKLKINQFDKKAWKNRSQPVLIFKTHDPSNEDETNHIKDKKKNKERGPNSIEKSVEIKCRWIQLKKKSICKRFKKN